LSRAFWLPRCSSEQQCTPYRTPASSVLVELPAITDDGDIERELRSAPALASAIDGKDVAPLVIVPGKIISIVAR
jgi:hypothetical protein